MLTEVRPVAAIFSDLMEGSRAVIARLQAE